MGYEFLLRPLLPWLVNLTGHQVPQAVMEDVVAEAVAALLSADDEAVSTLVELIMDAQEAAVADDVAAAIVDERFLILPHPEVLDMYRRKGADYDRWLAGMRRYQQTLLDQQ